MKIIDFNKQHISKALSIVRENYEEERVYVPELQETEAFPDLTMFAENGLGVSAFEGEKMLGFLCCYEPWKNDDSSLLRTFSPINAHGTVLLGREALYKRLYQAAAEKWVSRKIMFHGISLYAHDTKAAEAFFTYSFGLRCVDALRTLEPINCALPSGITYRKTEKSEVSGIRELRRMLSEHFGKSPCFMYTAPEDFEKEIVITEQRDTDIYIAEKEGKPIAFIEVTDNGENFVTEAVSMRNICGAFCMPEYRGEGIVQNLLNYIIKELREKGFTRLGVDFESINPTANAFWNKHFKAYTHSVVRVIDESALRS